MGKKGYKLNIFTLGRLHIHYIVGQFHVHNGYMQYTVGHFLHPYVTIYTRTEDVYCSNAAVQMNIRACCKEVG
jgi:hypothetical protein